MWWNVLIIPSGYRYKVALGKGDFDILANEYKEISERIQIRYIFMYEKSIANLGFAEREQFNKEVSDEQILFAKKHNSTIVSNKTLEMIKSTENEHVDILVDLDVDNINDFNHTYDSGATGAIDILQNNNGIMLVRSSWNEIRSKIESDYRFNKLSDEGKKIALDRAKIESRDKDSEVIFSWIKRLKASINKTKKTNTYASVFDGLK